MARPIKQGLEYFPMDVGFLSDIKVRRVLRAGGCEGLYILLWFFDTIYKDEGYFLRYDEEVRFMAADTMGLEEEKVQLVVDKATEVGLFDGEIYKNYSILTSKGIQRRYLMATLRRKEVQVLTELVLVRGFVRDNIALVSGQLAVKPAPMPDCGDGEEEEAGVSAAEDCQQSQETAVSETVSLMSENSQVLPQSTAAPFASEETENGETTENQTEIETETEAAELVKGGFLSQLPSEMSACDNTAGISTATTAVPPVIVDPQDCIQALPVPLVQPALCPPAASLIAEPAEAEGPQAHSKDNAVPASKGQAAKRAAETTPANTPAPPTISLSFVPTELSLPETTIVKENEGAATECPAAAMTTAGHQKRSDKKAAVASVSEGFQLQRTAAFAAWSAGWGAPETLFQGELTRLILTFGDPLTEAAIKLALQEEVPKERALRVLQRRLQTWRAAGVQELAQAREYQRQQARQARANQLPALEKPAVTGTDSKKTTRKKPHAAGSGGQSAVRSGANPGGRSATNPGATHETNYGTNHRAGLDAAAGSYHGTSADRNRSAKDGGQQKRRQTTSSYRNGRLYRRDPEVDWQAQPVAKCDRQQWLKLQQSCRRLMGADFQPDTIYQATAAELEWILQEEDDWDAPVYLQAAGRYE